VLQQALAAVAWAVAVVEMTVVAVPRAAVLRGLPSRAVVAVLSADPTAAMACLTLALDLTLALAVPVVAFAVPAPLLLESLLQVTVDCPLLPALIELLAALLLAPLVDLILAARVGASLQLFLELELPPDLPAPSAVPLLV
jgi:hypothetical protein